MTRSRILTHFWTIFDQLPDQDRENCTRLLDDSVQNRQKGGPKRGQKRVKNGSKWPFWVKKVIIFEKTENLMVRSMHFLKK